MHGAEPVAAVRELTGGGADIGLDALGSPATATASVLSLRRRGRHIQVGLLLGPAAGLKLPMDRVVAHELELHGSHGMAAHEYPAMLDLVARRSVPLDRLVGAVISLPEAPAALMGMDELVAASAGITVIDLHRGGQVT